MLTMKVKDNNQPTKRRSMKIIFLLICWLPWVMQKSPFYLFICGKLKFGKLKAGIFMILNFSPHMFENVSLNDFFLTFLCCFSWNITSNLSNERQSFGPKDTKSHLNPTQCSPQVFKTRWAAWLKSLENHCHLA